MQFQKLNGESLGLTQGKIIDLVNEAVGLNCRDVGENPRCGEILNELKPLIDGNAFIVIEDYGERSIDLDADGLHFLSKMDDGKWAYVDVEDREVKIINDLYAFLRQRLDGLVIVKKDSVIETYYYVNNAGKTILSINVYG